MSTIFLGTELKLSISIDPIGNESMETYLWYVEVYTSSRRFVKIEKKDAIFVDKDTYVIMVDTEQIGPGKVKCKVTAFIPDEDFSDLTRKEVVIIDPEITIVKDL